MVGEAKTKYDELRTAIVNAARARAAAAKIEENEKQLLELEPQLEREQAAQRQKQKNYDEAVAANKQAEAEHRPAVSAAALGDSREMKSNETQAHVGALNKAKDNVRTAQAELENANNAVSLTQKKIDTINKANAQLAEKYKISATSANTDKDVETETDLPTGDIPTGTAAVTDKFAAEKEWREREQALARIAYATGESDYLAYIKRMDEIAAEFFERQLLHQDLSDSERLKITADWREAQRKLTEDDIKGSAELEDVAYQERLAEAKQFYIDGQYSKETYDEAVERMELEHLRNLTRIYREGSKEKLQADANLQNALFQQAQRRQQKLQETEQKLAAMKNEFFGDNPSEKQAKYDADLDLLKTVYDREIAAAGENADEKLRIEEAFQQAKLALQKKYGLLAEEDTRNSAKRAVDASVEWLNSDGGKAVQGAISTLTSGMGAIFSSLSSLVQAELEIETAAISKRYEKEVSAAEGNSYRVKKLEKEKERDIAKAKNDANRKMFAMQVIQAVAQTAQNALSAYGSAAAIPMVGYILAPIAAAMAVAAGMVQIAAIKKQQQASASQGYSSGGFTPDGSPETPVGIVHAGEWVASQRLVKSTQTRPLIEALDYAQRTNTVGSLKAADVSRSITAPMALASLSASNAVPDVVVNVPASISENPALSQAIDRLNKRLSEPFVTVATITGDKGINKAQEDYDRLLKNKSPKYRK